MKVGMVTSAGSKKMRVACEVVYDRNGEANDEVKRNDASFSFSVRNGREL